MDSAPFFGAVLTMMIWALMENRISPLPPHWVVNVVAPHLGIGVIPFWVSTFLGIMGVTVIHTTIGGQYLPLFRTLQCSLSTVMSGGFRFGNTDAIHISVVNRLGRAVTCVRVEPFADHGSSFFIFYFYMYD